MTADMLVEAKFDVLVEALTAHRFGYANETELQDGITQTLTHDWQLQREVQLGGGRGRIDFLVGDVGIEVKVAGNTAALTRQINRYLTSPRLAGLLVVTTRRVHLVPTTLQGKPVRVAVVGGGL